MDEGGWRYILGGERWVNIFHGWVRVGGMEVYFGWREVGEHFSWVGEGGWNGGIFWVSGWSLALV